MFSEGDRQRLSDIRDNVARIRRFLGSMSLAEFERNEMAYFAVVHSLLIISEAARHLSDDVKARHPEIDWVAIRDSGNVYRHAYFSVTEMRIWETANLHLPALEKVVLSELANAG